MKSSKFKIATAASLFVLLASCGDSDSTTTIPANDSGTTTGGTTTDGTTTGGTTTGGTTTGGTTTGGTATGGIGGLPTGAFTGETTGGTTTGGTTSNTTQISTLYGDAVFVFKFTNEQPLFGIVTRWNSSQLMEDAESGQVILGSEDAVLVIDEGGDGTNFQADGTVDLLCAFIDEAEVFYCASSVNDDAGLVNFLFPALVNGQSQGNFTLCETASQTLEQCITELVNNPDGPVAVNISPSGTNALVSNADTGSRSNYAASYLTYFDQGTVRTTPSLNDSDSNKVAQIMEIQQSLLQQLSDTE